MKKFLSITIAILVIAIIAGAFAYNNLNAPSGIIQAEIDSYDLENGFSLVSKDNYVMFCTMNPDGIEESVYLVLLNAKNGKLKSKTKITDLDLVDGCKFGDEDTIIVTDSENNKSAKYDMNMNLMEITDYFFEDSNVTGEKSPFYNDKTSVNVGQSTYVSDVGARFTYFYDDLNTVYVQNDKNKYDLAYYQKIVLNKIVGSDNNIIEYCVDDYENSCTLSTQQIECAENCEISDFLSCVGDKYAFVITFEVNVENDVYQCAGYSWNYKNDKQNADNGVKKYSANEIKDLNESIINEFADKYKLNIQVNNPNAEILSRVSCEDTYNDIEVNNILTSLQDFIKKLPDGMITEIYSDYNYLDIEYVGIRIDLVNEITTENVLAFSETFGDEMRICFSIDKFKFDTVPHEFMHLIDTRIEDYLEKDSLFDYWANEIGQDYTTANKEDTNQFITEYAATNDVEDRAEIFAFLFSTADDEEMPVELTNEGINAKAKIICELIRESFPSVKNSNSVYWEKYMPLSS